MTGTNGRHPLPDPERLKARLGAVGIGNDTQVVVHDDAQGMIAGRLWWLLRWLGHTRVAFLDGGFPLWQAEGRPVDAVLRRGRRRGLPALPIRAWWSMRRPCSPASNPGTLPDRCPRSRSLPRRERSHRSGGWSHSRGAQPILQDNLEADGRFKPAALLRAEYLALMAGAAPAQVVAQCGSGVSACLDLLAMEIAGLHGARLYAGSWSEWCSDPARPVAR